MIHRSRAARRRLLVPVVAVAAALVGSALVAAPAQAASTVTYTGVVTGGGGATLAGIRVAWYSPTDGSYGVTATHSDGHYSLVAKTGQPYYLTANADIHAPDPDGYSYRDAPNPLVPGYASEFSGTGDAQDHAWQVLAPYTADDAGHEVDFALDRVGTIDVHGDLTRAYVELLTVSGDYIASNDYYGYYGDDDDVTSVSFPHMVPGRYRVLTFGAKDGAPTVSDPITLLPGKHLDVDAVTDAGATLAGNVTWSGQDVPRLPVVAVDSSGYFAGYGRTDANGHFSIPGLVAGDYSVQTYPFAPDVPYDYYGGGVVPTADRAGAAATAPQAGASSRAPLALRSPKGDRVTIAGSDPARARMSAHIAAQARTAAASAPAPVTGYQPSITAVTGLKKGSTRHVDIAVRHGARIVATYSGLPSRTYVSQVIVKSASFIRYFYGATRGFSAPSLPSGTYQVYLVTSRGTYGTKRVSITAGRTTDAGAISVTRKALTLHVAAGSDFAHSFVSLRNLSTGTYASGFTDGTGRAYLTGILPGTQRPTVGDPHLSTGGFEFGYGYGYAPAPADDFAMSTSTSKALHVTPLGSRILARFTVQGFPVTAATVSISGSDTRLSGYGRINELGRLDTYAPAGDDVLHPYPYTMLFQQNSPYAWGEIPISVPTDHLTSFGTLAVPVDDGSEAP